MKTLIILTVGLCISTGFSQAKRDDKKVTSQSTSTSKSNEGVLWGETFVDYSYAAQAENAVQKGTNAFEIRRIYLGYEQDISGQFSARILLEGDNGDTTTSGAMTFYIDQAYIQWKNLVPLSSIYFGLSSTPPMALAEKFWGYRSLKEVFLVSTGLMSINDMGAGIKGKLVSDGSVGYALMVGNGKGVKSENDKFKKIYGEFYFTPMKSSVVELYADYENSPNAQSKLTGKALLGYQVASVSAGVEGFYRTVHNGAFNSVPLADSNLVGGSAYTSFQIAENIRGVLRGDYYDANVSETTVGVREIFSVVGVDYSPVQDVHLIPNALYTHRMYKVSPAPGPALVDDITFRLTFAYSFSARIQ
jgi:hypothetical protein